MSIASPKGSIKSQSIIDLSRINKQISKIEETAEPSLESTFSEDISQIISSTVKSSI